MPDTSTRWTHPDAQPGVADRVSLRIAPNVVWLLLTDTLSATTTSAELSPREARAMAGALLAAAATAESRAQETRP